MKRQLAQQLSTVRRKSSKGYGVSLFAASRRLILDVGFNPRELSNEFASRQRRLKSGVADATRKSFAGNPALKRRANVIPPLRGEEYPTLGGFTVPCT
jgi:hypothetical protein